MPTIKSLKDKGSKYARMYGHQLTRWSTPNFSKTHKCDVCIAYCLHCQKRYTLAIDNDVYTIDWDVACPGTINTNTEEEIV
jgi:hypothetical protein